MTNWKTYKLGEIATIIDSLHKTPTYSSSGYPMVRVTDIKKGPLNLITTLKVSKEVYEEFSKKYKAKKGDIVMSRVGTYGVTSYVKDDNPFCLGQNTLFVVPKIHSKFLYYSICSPVVRENIDSLATGSTQKTISLKSIKNLNIKTPDLPTQRRISEILSALDDKIELNRRMNQTLEQMAQTLFRQYFVDGIDEVNLPEGWQEGKLGDILELVYGKALKQGDRKGGEYPVVGSSGVVGFHNTFIADGKGIVVGRKGNAGAIIWLDEKFYPIDTTYFVVDRLQVDDLYYHYFLLKSLPLAGMNSDSAVPGLNRNEAYNVDILIPNPESIIDFNNKVKSLFELKYKNEKETNTLTTLRDTLLPKLMSGEIDVMQTQAADMHEPILS